MKMPNGNRAIVDNRKLLSYVLNPNHSEHQGHAVLFKQLLNIDWNNAHILKDALLRAAEINDAVPGKPSPHGDKYEIRFQMTASENTYTIMSVWMIETPLSAPRLVTAFVE